MASAAERFHIVLSSDERRAWNASASKLGVPTAEYVRRAVASYETGLSSEELDQLSILAVEVERSADRMHTMIDHAAACIDRPIDEQGMRAQAETRLRQDPVMINPALLDFSGGPETAQAA